MTDREKLAAQIKEVATDLEALHLSQYERLRREYPDPYRVVDPHGVPVLLPILTARADVLSAQVRLMEVE